MICTGFETVSVGGTQVFNEKTQLKIPFNSIVLVGGKNVSLTGQIKETRWHGGTGVTEKMYQVLQHWTQPKQLAF